MLAVLAVLAVLIRLIRSIADVLILRLGNFTGMVRKESLEQLDQPC